MRSTAFMGTPAIAVPALRALAELTSVRVVITQPDRPAGRGRQLTPPPVKVAADALGLPVWQPATLRGQAGDPRLHGLDLIVVMAFGQILREDVLALPRFGCVNLHGSLLPRWRGASPLQAALRAGDARTGISVMRMVRACDAGPVYARHPFDLPADATLAWLHDRMADEAAAALRAFLAAWPPGEPEAQDERLVTVCGKLDKADARLDAARPAAELARQVRAYTPIPGCWIDADGTAVRIHAVEVRPATPGAVPGTASVISGELRLHAADGDLAVLRLQSPGGTAMPAADWLRGHRPPARW